MPFEELKEVSQESKTIIESEGLGITEHFIDLKYDYWTSGTCFLAYHHARQLALIICIQICVCR
jgi:hypothetical protein